MGAFDILIDPLAASQSFAALVGSGAASAFEPVSAAGQLAVSEYGTVVGSGNATFAAIVELPSAKDVAMLAEGAGIDAANPDIRWIVAPCRQFEDESYPLEGARLELTEDGAAVSFTVLSRAVTQIAGVDTQLRMLVYRTPQPDSATVAPVGETGAGLPKQYAPVVNAN
jgi:hypothetical protein